jgi:2-haloacid dehalogenase
MTPAAILFDVFGTLLDVYSVQSRAESLFPGQGMRVAQLWRDTQLEYTRLRSLSARYVPFSQLTYDALQFTCEALGIEAPENALRELMQQYDALAAFPEVPEVLGELSARGLTLGVLSNGEPARLQRCLGSAGLLGRLPLVLSADAVHIYKTAAPVYQLGVDALRRPASEILFVSSNGWDACGATWFGYATCWINRAGMPLERLGVNPHHTGRSLHAVLDALR